MKIRVSIYGRVLHLVDDLLVFLRNYPRLTRKNFAFKTNGLEILRRSFRDRLHIRGLGFKFVDICH